MNHRNVARHGARVAGVSGLVLIGKFALLWLSDFLVAPPIIALTALLGFWGGFVISAIVYSIVSYWLTIRVLRVVEHRRTGPLTRRIGRLLEKQARKEQHDNTGQWLMRVMRRDPGVGLTLSSVLAGGIVTVLFWRFLWPSRDLSRTAIYANVVFGVTFAFTYAGGVALLLHLF